MNLLRLATLSLVAIIFLLFSCSKSGDPIDLNDAKEIIRFSLTNADGSAFSDSLTIAIHNDTVDVTVPYGTQLNGLIPEIYIKGKTISPASGVPQNFTVPIVYTITAEDGSSVSYVVIIKAALPENMVYFGSSDKNFYAVDGKTGLLVWKYAGTASFVYSSPTYANGIVYVGSIDNYVYAFDAMSGSIKWKYKMGTTGIESDAVVADGMVFVGCNDDYLVALDGTNGNFKWQFNTTGNISASPTVANGTVYFGCSDNNLYALDETTGSLKWKYTTGAMINQSGPALVNGVIYVGSRDGYLYAIDAVTGTLNWRYGTNGISLEQSSATIANGIVYIGGWYDLSNFSRSGSLYAVDAATGSLAWEALANTGIASSPCVVDGKLYITTDDNNLYALDALTGNIFWSKQILANGASPAVANGIVYVGGGGTRYFYAFNALSGDEIWKFGLPQGLDTSSPLIVSFGTVSHSGDSGELN